MSFHPSMLLIVVGMALMITVPVMLAAKALGTERSGFFICLTAVLLIAVLDALVGEFSFLSGFSGWVVFALSAVVFSVLLGTGILKGAGIAILSVFLFVVLMLLLNFLGVAEFEILFE